MQHPFLCVCLEYDRFKYFEWFETLEETIHDLEKKQLWATQFTEASFKLIYQFEKDDVFFAHFKDTKQRDEQFYHHLKTFINQSLQKKYKISIYERPLTHINMFLSKTSSILRKYKIREQVWIYFQGPFGIFQHESYHGCYIQNSCRGMTRYKHCQKFLKKAAKCGKICMIEKYCNYVYIIFDHIFEMTPFELNKKLFGESTWTYNFDGIEIVQHPWIPFHQYYQRFEKIANACSLEIRFIPEFVVLLFVTLDTFDFIRRHVQIWKQCFPFEKHCVFSLYRKGSFHALFIEYTCKEKWNNEYNFVLEMEQSKTHPETKKNWRERRKLESYLKQTQPTAMDEFVKRVNENHQLFQIQCVPHQSKSQGYDSFWISIVVFKKDPHSVKLPSEDPEWIVYRIQHFFKSMKGYFQNENIQLNENNIPVFSFQWIVPQIKNPCDIRYLDAWAKHLKNDLFGELFKNQIYRPSLKHPTMAYLWNQQFYRMKISEKLFHINFESSFANEWECICCGNVGHFSMDLHFHIQNYILESTAQQDNLKLDQNCFCSFWKSEISQEGLALQASKEGLALQASKEEEKEDENSFFSKNQHHIDSFLKFLVSKNEQKRIIQGGFFNQYFYLFYEY